jgi:hypothetical protein
MSLVDVFEVFFRVAGILILIQGFFLLTGRGSAFRGVLKTSPAFRNLESVERLALGIFYFIGGMAITISIVLEILGITESGVLGFVFFGSVFVIAFLGGIIANFRKISDSEATKSKRKDTQPLDKISYFEED